MAKTFFSAQKNRRKERYASFLLMALLVAAVMPACVSAQNGGDVEPVPAKVLFVGNSFTYYNNSVHNHYSALVSASGRSFDTPRVTRIMTLSGGHLPEHRAGLSSILRSQDWDVVVLQGHSLGPISEATAEPFRVAARDFSAMIRARGARPVLFMTWAYEGKPEMTDALDHAYSSLGQELGAQVVPVGLAFARVTEERPDIGLRITDGKHPTLAGTYLAACTFYAALFGQSPQGLSYSADLDAEVAAYLQAVAWQTLLNYRTRVAR